MLVLPLIELGTDVLESLRSLSNFFSLGLGFLFVSLLLKSMSEDIEEFKLDRCADLASQASPALRWDRLTSTTAAKIPSSMIIV
jgi:hypothetical protein